MKADPQWLTPKEAHFTTGVDPKTLIVWTRRGLLHPKRKNARVIWYDRAELLAVAAQPHWRGKDKSPRRK